MSGGNTPLGLLADFGIIYLEALMGPAVRHLLFSVFVLGILWAVDTLSFDGRYSSAI